jgi:uncharacterized repeat protein (TIGR03803 family)
MSNNRRPQTLGTALFIAITAVLVLAPCTWAQSKYKTLYGFKGGADGGEPFAGLIFDQAGNLYGTTDYGGKGRGCASGTCGVVFKLTPNSDGSWKESVLYAFCQQMSCSDGANPFSSVIFDAVGNLYGTTYVGGGNGGGSGVV